MLLQKKGKMGRFKIAIVFVITFLLTISPSLAQAQKDLSALVKKVTPSVVVINVFDKANKLKGVGTGFFVREDGALVTNYHVIEGGMRAEVKLSNGEVLPIEGIISEDKEADLALLSLGVKKRTFPVLKLSDTKIEAGQPVVLIGSPFGLEGTVSNGIVSAIRDIPTLGKMLQITAPISKGSSGSPVLNMKGELVGVATSYIKEGQSINFAISVDRVNSLLSRQKAKVQKFLELEKGDGKKWLESAEGLFLLGCSSYINGRYEDAISFFKRSIQKRPDNADAYINIGFVYLKLGRLSEAIGPFREAIRIKPDDATAYSNLGLTYRFLGHYYDAIEAYKQVIRIEPNNAMGYNGLGSAYDMLNRHYEAIEAYKQAIRIEPNDFWAYLSIGLNYDALGRYYEAIDAYKQAIRIKPDNPMAHFRLGLVYLSVGDRSMALEQYRILKDLDTEKANKLFNLIY